MEYHRRPYFHYIINYNYYGFLYDCFRLSTSDTEYNLCHLHNSVRHPSSHTRLTGCTSPWPRYLVHPLSPPDRVHHRRLRHSSLVYDLHRTSISIAVNDYPNHSLPIFLSLAPTVTLKNRTHWSSYLNVNYLFPFWSPPHPKFIFSLLKLKPKFYQLNL